MMELEIAIDAPDSCCAVVGADGFLGRALVSRLKSLGVPALTFTRGNPVLSGVDLKIPADVKTVFWLASSITPSVAEVDPDAVDEDVQAFRSFLNALSRKGSQGKQPRVIIIGSGGTVYSPSSVPPYSEMAPLHYGTAYAAAKLRLEQVLQSCYGGPHVILRAANVYGPGQLPKRGQGVIAHWMDAIVRHQPISVFGNKNSTRDYLYIEDAVSAMVKVAHIDPALPLPSVINVGSGRPCSLMELAMAVLAATGSTATSLVFAPGRFFDTDHNYLNVERAATMIGWRPETTLEAGLKNTWAWHNESPCATDVSTLSARARR